MDILFSKYWVLFAAAWYTVNGMLHDIFVTINHKGKYDRELLRLLMDGHVLILSGIFMFLSFMMVQHKITYGVWAALVTGLGMLVYCLMILPFLKSFGTIAVSAIVMIVSIKLLLTTF